MASPIFSAQTNLFCVTVMIAGLSVPMAAAQEQQPPPIQDPLLRAYVQHVDREWPGESHQQAITVESLILLIDAIRSVAENEPVALLELAGGLEKLRQQIRLYAGGTPDQVTQSEMLRRTFLIASELIARLVRAAGVEKEPVDPRLSALQRSAESLDPRQPQRRQPDVIERFFHHAGQALLRVKRSQVPQG